MKDIDKLTAIVSKPIRFEDEYADFLSSTGSTRKPNKARVAFPCFMLGAIRCNLGANTALQHGNYGLHGQSTVHFIEGKRLYVDHNTQWTTK